MCKPRSEIWMSFFYWVKNIMSLGVLGRHAAVKWAPWMERLHNKNGGLKSKTAIHFRYVHETQCLKLESPERKLWRPTSSEFPVPYQDGFKVGFEQGDACLQLTCRAPSDAEGPEGFCYKILTSLQGPQGSLFASLHSLLSAPRQILLCNHT